MARIEYGGCFLVRIDLLYIYFIPAVRFCVQAFVEFLCASFCRTDGGRLHLITGNDVGSSGSSRGCVKQNKDVWLASYSSSAMLILVSEYAGLS